MKEQKLTEGKKLYSINPNKIGKVKYSIDFHDGKSKHKDGSPFIGIDTAKTKKELQLKLDKYKSKGYKLVNSVFNTLHEQKITEAKFKDIDVKKLGKKKTNDLMKYLFNIVDLGLKTDMKTDTKKKILSVNISKISPKVAQNIQKRFGVDLTEQKSSEQKLREAIRKIIREDFAGAYPTHKREKFDNKRRKQSEVLGYKLTGVNDVRTEIDDATVKEGAGGMGPAKKGKQSHANVRHKTSEKELSIVNSKSVLRKYAKLGYLPYNPKDKYKYGSLKWKAPKMKNGVVAEGKLIEAKESAIDVAKRVVQNKQHEKGLDLTTANFIMQVYKAYDKNPSLQRKLEKLPLKKMISIVYKLIK
jgi:hypothetical protein